MTKKLFLVRHAEAEKPGDKPDIERKLTSEGSLKFNSSIDRLLQKDKSIDKILASAAERAKQTAHIIKAKLIVGEFKITEQLYECSTKEMIKIIESEKSGIDRLMLVGHNPVIFNVVNHYCDEAINNVSAGTIMKLVFEVDEWQNISQNSATMEYII